MVKNLVIVSLSLALLSCLYGGVYSWITADTARAMQSDYPELEWLRREYELSDGQFSEIRKMHEEHDIVCRELCRDLVATQKDLESVISTHPQISTEVQEALAAWTRQRNRCREATLSHMYEVSSVMKDDAASRYRESIFRHLIVPGKMPHIGKNGEFHEELIEHAAPDSSGSLNSDDD
ncbi:MAG: hypothetical protein P1U86_08245 [Verrucomicrobiales bacterium]|nr:hypothetical protein [Verrucomicrobiales bacterium]